MKQQKKSDNEIDQLKEVLKTKEKEIEKLERLVETNDRVIKKLQEEKDHLVEEIIKCRNEKESIAKQKDDYKNLLDKYRKAQPKTLTTGVVDAITYLVQNYFPRLSKARVGCKIADACWEILGGIAQFQLMRYAC